MYVFKIVLSHPEFHATIEICVHVNTPPALRFFFNNHANLTMPLKLSSQTRYFAPFGIVPRYAHLV